MPQRLSDIFDVSPILLSEHNVFNGFIELDSQLYLDPRLLSQTSVNELNNIDETVLNYFNEVLENILTFIEYQKNGEQSAQNECKNNIIKKLKFPEIPIIGLGYSINHNSGKGIGAGLATSLSSTIIEIVKKGIKDPIIFQLAGVFEKKIGSDMISDMIFCILLPNLVEFTHRIATELKLKTSKYSTKINSKYFDHLPCCPTQINANPGKGFLLVPQDILTSLPVADSWTDRDVVAIHNDELRKSVNQKITKYTYKTASYKKIVKSKNLFRDIVLQEPEIMRDFISQYKAKIPIPYDFKKDSDDVFKWHDTARDYANRFPLNITGSSGKCSLSNEEIVEKICVHFRDLVVNKGLSCAFYKAGREPKKEEKGQLILLELLEKYLNLKGSPLRVEYVPKYKVINLCDISSFIVYTIILKFTSTAGINRIYDGLIEKIYMEFPSSYTILFLIQVDGGKTIQEVASQFQINSSDNENDFFRKVRKVYIDATSKF